MRQVERLPEAPQAEAQNLDEDAIEYNEGDPVVVGSRQGAGGKFHAYSFVLWLKKRSFVHVKLRTMFQHLAAEIRYLIVSKERTPTTGQLHAQGYIVWNRAQRGTRLLAALGADDDEGWWLVAKGTPQQNRAYCTKRSGDPRWPNKGGRIEEGDEDFDDDAGPFEMGNIDNVGRSARSDRNNIAAAVKRGASEMEIANEYPSAYLDFGPKIARLRAAQKGGMDLAPVFREPPQLYIAIGDPGVGKSEWARRFLLRDQKLPPDDIYTLPLPPKATDKVWWPGYTHQKGIVIDEMHKGALSIQYLNQMIDRYQFAAETKGAFVTNFQPRFVVMTSNFEWRSWFDEKTNPKTLQSFGRRITKVLHFKRCCKRTYYYSSRMIGSDGFHYYIEEDEEALREQVRKFEIVRDELRDIDRKVYEELLESASRRGPGRVWRRRRCRLYAARAAAPVASAPRRHGTALAAPGLSALVMSPSQEATLMEL